MPGAEPGPAEALQRVLGLTGLALPRGVLGPEVARLARALSGDPHDAVEGDVADLAGAAAAAHWPELREPMRAGLERGRAGAAPEDVPAFEMVLRWADDPDPDNPLARALAVRAAAGVQLAVARSRERLAAAEALVARGGPGGAAAAASAAGAVAVDLLDLDPEDFEPEIVAYVDADRSPEALDELARSTGDTDIRAWARSAVAGLDAPGAPATAAALAELGAGEPPEDPREDIVWVATVLALAETAVEHAVALGAEGGLEEP